MGADSALNLIVDSVDRVRQAGTASRRCFVVETMGSRCGYLALMAGIAGGAETVVIPEMETDPDAVAAELRAAYERGDTPTP